MRKFILTLSAIVLTAGGLAGCNGMQQQDVGMVLGGVAGGYIGNQISDSTAGTIAGTVAGGYLGRQLSKP